jgi:hypothetical protein
MAYGRPSVPAFGNQFNFSKTVLMSEIRTGFVRWIGSKLTWKAGALPNWSNAA